MLTKFEITNSRKSQKKTQRESNQAAIFTITILSILSLISIHAILCRIYGFSKLIFSLKFKYLYIRVHSTYNSYDIDVCLSIEIRYTIAGKGRRKMLTGACTGLNSGGWGVARGGGQDLFIEF